MGRILVNDDELDKAIDYLLHIAITQDDTLAEWHAGQLYIYGDYKLSFEEYTQEMFKRINKVENKCLN